MSSISGNDLRLQCWQTQLKQICDALYHIHNRSLCELVFLFKDQEKYSR